MECDRRKVTSPEVLGHTPLSSKAVMSLSRRRSSGPAAAVGSLEAPAIEAPTYNIGFSVHILGVSNPKPYTTRNALQLERQNSGLPQTFGLSLGFQTCYHSIGAKFGEWINSLNVDLDAFLRGSKFWDLHSKLATGEWGRPGGNEEGAQKCRLHACAGMLALTHEDAGLTSRHNAHESMPV